MKINLDLLKELSESFGPSGYEDEVREIIMRELEKQGIRYSVDGVGNVIAMSINNESKKTVLLDAHIDEVGLLITNITKNGFLFFEILGGIDERILPSQCIKIRGNNGYVYGVIGSKPPHLLVPEEKNKTVPYRKLFIDVGASSKDEVYNMGIEEGAPAVFYTKFVVQGNRVLGKAFDDRVGAFVLLETLKLVSSKANIIAVFSVQEEVGIRGAKVASESIKADYMIAIEGTAAGDMPGVPEQETSTILGYGPAITIADRATLSSRFLVRKFIEIAKGERIPYQFKGRMVGGTDASAFRYSRWAIPSITISVPSRYIHSSCSVSDIGDITNTISLICKAVEELSLG